MSKPIQKYTKLDRQKREKRRARPTKTQVPIYPKAIEARYRKLAKGISDDLKRMITSEVLPNLETMEEIYKAELAAPTLDSQGVARFDGFWSFTKRIIGGVLIEYESLVDLRTQEITEIGEDVDELSRREIHRSIRSKVGVDVIASDPALSGVVKMWVAENVDLIKRIGEDEAKQIERIVYQGYQQGLRHEEVARNIRDTFIPSEKRKGRLSSGKSINDRAAMIARDQIGSLHGEVDKQRMKNIGLVRYTWRTSMDEKVRDSHQELEGRVFYFDSSLGETAPEGEPGMPILCRCTAEPVVDDLFIELE